MTDVAVRVGHARELAERVVAVGVRAVERRHRRAAAGGVVGVVEPREDRAVGAEVDQVE